MTNLRPCVVDTLGMEDSHIAEQMRLGNWERCEYCKCVFIWNMLPEENVMFGHEKHEFWGAPCYETIVEGFICPECGYKTTF